MLSPAGEKNVDVQLLATYGTLRDDNDSEAPWAVDFIKDIHHAVTGRTFGYKLFGHPTLTYPFAIFTGDPKDSIVVRLLSWPSKQRFDQKIIEADKIEGDDYERKIIEALVDGGTKHAYIYVSKSNTLDEHWRPIPSGDWLQRRARVE